MCFSLCQLKRHKVENIIDVTIVDYIFGISTSGCIFTCGLGSPHYLQYLYYYHHYRIGCIVSKLKQKNYTMGICTCVRICACTCMCFTEWNPIKTFCNAKQNKAMENIIVFSNDIFF